MVERVTIQDIADELGLSRNTVSKAINNTGILADSTREKILQKAIEMGYKQFTYMNVSNLNLSGSYDITPNETGEIAILTCTQLGNSHFSATMIDKFQREITHLGYSLTMHRITNDEQKRLVLPNSFNKERTVGIMCFEMFNYAYAQMVCSLDLPVLLVDSPVLDGRPLNADRLYMNNRDEIFSFVREMKKRGKTKIGFIGEYKHCQSFFERYMSYKEAMYLNELEYKPEYCLLCNNVDEEYPTTSDYQAFLLKSLEEMKELPEVFICANDFVAIDVLQVFRKLDILVPRDIYLCGFDDSPESRIVTPPLTTIHIHNEILGFSAVQLLLSRIKEPTLNYRALYTETNLVYRESTNN
ncbi:MAG: LacI family DNA-binding transcriptional regulator [Lachnospiraceae bacterium]